jgi:hypothetical protein
MRASVVLTAAILLGLLVGAGVSWFELSRKPDDFGYPLTTDTITEHALAGPQPKITVLGGESYDFGHLDSRESGEHTFTIRNDGEGDLEVAPGETSCSCTVSQPSTDLVPPGETVDITVSWRPQSTGSRYSQTASIHTNDPRRPEVVFTVSGYATHRIDHEPRMIDFGSLSPTETQTRTCNIYSYQDSNLSAANVRLTNPSMADYFEWSVRSLTTEELASERYAKSGVRLELTAKSGLPLGGILQTILLTTNIEDAPLVEIPIVGQVRGDVQLFGARNFNKQWRVLDLGVVERGKTYGGVYLKVGGPQRQTVKPIVASVFPEQLEVIVGKRLGVNADPETNEFRVYQFPLAVKIPNDFAAADHLGGSGGRGGEVVLQLDGLGDEAAQPPQIRFSVSFAVR